MQTKTDAQLVSTDDFFYDLFDGGYINPRDLLVEEDAKKVEAAMLVIRNFEDTLNTAGLLEYR